LTSTTGAKLFSSAAICRLTTEVDIPSKFPPRNCRIDDRDKQMKGQNVHIALLLQKYQK
jgi:hypothetical protein